MLDHKRRLLLRLLDCHRLREEVHAGADAGFIGTLHVRVVEVVEHDLARLISPQSQPDKGVLDALLPDSIPIDIALVFRHVDPLVRHDSPVFHVLHQPLFRLLEVLVEETVLCHPVQYRCEHVFVLKTVDQIFREE